MLVAHLAEMRPQQVGARLRMLPDGLFEPTDGMREGLRPEFRTAFPVMVEVSRPGSGAIFTVPAGYVTDLYSLPTKLLQAWQPHKAHWWAPALLHDWLYDVGYLERHICDAILLSAMKAVGVRFWHRNIVYQSVRLGGRRGFNSPLLANYDLVQAERARPLDARLAAYLAAWPRPA